MKEKIKLGLNPWLSILTKPKQTIRVIVEYNSNYHLLLLSIIYGFSAILGIIQRFKLGATLDFMSIIVPTIILAPLWGYIAFSLSAFITLITGKLIKGQATFKELRAATAWSNVPMIGSMILWIFLFLTFGVNFFGVFATKESISTSQLWAIFSAMFLMFAISIWSLVIYVNALAEVQKFSIFKAILNIIMSAIIILIISFGIVNFAHWDC